MAAAGVCRLKRPLDKRFNVGPAAIAGLHSYRKGANKTPPFAPVLILTETAAPVRPAALGRISRAPAAGGEVASRRRGFRRVDRVFGGALTPRFPLYRHRRRRRGGRS